MTDITITISLDEATAEAFQAASTEDQRKIQLLFGLLLREYTAPSSLKLNELMDNISTRAEERGLTPEILEQLFDDEA